MHQLKTPLLPQKGSDSDGRQEPRNDLALSGMIELPPLWRAALAGAGLDGMQDPILEKCQRIINTLHVIALDSNLVRCLDLKFSMNSFSHKSKPSNSVEKIKNVLYGRNSI